MTLLRPSPMTLRHGHLFCGIGAGAAGFNLANPRAGRLTGRFVCAGGIDVDAGAIENFGRLTGTAGTVLDLFSRAQYAAFHGREPPPEWREAGPEDIRAALGPKLHVCFTSAPCKGFSGLLSTSKSLTDKYQALNGLTKRGIWLTLEAYKDDPVDIILFENVPRIMTRGHALLDEIMQLLRAYGYIVNLEKDAVHDCGEIGGLGQSRKRYLMIARHPSKVPDFVYQPTRHRLRGVGEIIGKLPLPGDPIGGTHHRVPMLQWKTWVRLALVPAGRDWRALNDLRVIDGQLADYGIVPEHELQGASYGVCHWDDTAPTITSARAPGQGRFSVADPRAVDAGWNNEALGVRGWDDPARVVAAASRPANGAHSVADPRTGFGPNSHRNKLKVASYDEPAPTVTGADRVGSGALSVADPRPLQDNQTYGQYGVREWEKPVGAVTGQALPGGGPNSVADPRLGRIAHNNVFRVVPYDAPSPAVAGPGGPGGGLAVADPRAPESETYKKNKYKVTPFDGPAGAVIGASTTGNGAYAVADPRTGDMRSHALGVIPYDQPSGAVIGENLPTNGRFAVADPRPEGFRGGREHFEGGGHYGVVGWEETAGTVSASGSHDNGRNSVADPRDHFAGSGNMVDLPQPSDRLVARIVAMDGTWHRPFTTLDLASLQSLFDPEEAFAIDEATGQWRARAGFELVGGSDAMCREWIGNAVPSAAARGMAETIGETLLLAADGGSFRLDPREIWVKPGALALAVDSRQIAYDMEGGA